MKIKVTKRSAEKKSELTKTRIAGDIPAVLYGPKRENENLIVDGKDFSKLIRGLKKGHLPTTVLTLEHDKKEIKTIVKGIQYDTTTYRVIHLDLLELSEDATVDVNVPIDCIGEADCTGIKLGGFLRQVKRHLKVRCLPKDIPTAFEVDISPLGINNSLKVKDIKMSEAIDCRFPENEVVVVIAKR